MSCQTSYADPATITQREHLLKKIVVKALGKALLRMKTVALSKTLPRTGVSCSCRAPNQLGLLSNGLPSVMQSVGRELPN
ncbi:hypothetical protein D8674_019414 [Pyrus ussuriensis x Pyrus communis]|uniref:Uncharacterized protein n=1 Tax=Pyrus ussuriensis x Pyrus communis TaxID=2448454 RepID=A0A5N5GD53_9ROSA|nr:hypothetical protein D8674_019414 [Pyrus ussuriensis x Pyrus communis]